MRTPSHKNTGLFVLALLTACFALFDKVEPWVQSHLERTPLPGVQSVLVRTAWMRERLGLAKALARFDAAASPLFYETYKNRHPFADNEATLRLAELAQGGKAGRAAPEARDAPLPPLEALAGEGVRTAGPAIPGEPSLFSLPPLSAQAPAGQSAPAADAAAAMNGGQGPRHDVTPEELLKALALADGKVLVAGDSLSMALGVAVEKALKPRTDLSVVQRGKLSSGLLNPQFFNWVQAMGEFVPEHKPSLVIVMMGGNDAKYLSVQEDQGRVEAAPDKRLTVYRERLGRFLAVFDRFGIPCLWVGLPVMGDEEYDKQCQVLNSEVKKAIEASKWTRFLDTRSLLADDNGRYAQYVQLPNSGRVRVREMDKVHFNVAGGGILVAHMAPEVSKLMEKRPARAERTVSKTAFGPGLHARNLAEMDALPD